MSIVNQLDIKQNKGKESPLLQHPTYKKKKNNEISSRIYDMLMMFPLLKQKKNEKLKNVCFVGPEIRIPRRSSLKSPALSIDVIYVKCLWNYYPFSHSIPAHGGIYFISFEFYSLLISNPPTEEQKKKLFIPLRNMVI